MKGKTILVVDDEKEVVDALRNRLEREGYEVLTAYDGKQALEKANDRPDLILLDIIMPGLDGIEVLSRLKKNIETKHIPVVMVTAKGESKSILDAEDIEVTDYIIKPFDINELVVLIKKYLDYLA